MLRIAIGKTGWDTAVSRDGQLLPVQAVDIFLHVQNPTEVELLLVEQDGGDLTTKVERVSARDEEIQIVGVN